MTLVRSAASRLTVITEEERSALHQASLDLLESKGCRVPVKQARDLLASGGARVDGEQVRVPAIMVEKALASVRPITLYNRIGEPTLPLADGRVTFGALVDTFYLLDLERGAVRPFQRADQGRMARLLDALPHIDWVQCVGQSHDVPAELQTQLAALDTVANTTKPILAYPYDRAGVMDLLDLTAIVAGPGVDPARRPFLACASVPAAPLAASEYNLEILLTCAEHDVPVLYYSCPALGGNSPCSVAGTLTMANADWLFGLTLHQLAKPGAPFVSAGFTMQLMDMRTTLWAYCAPESLSAYAAVAQLAHGYGLPAFGLEMITDCPRLDAQAGIELAMNALWGMMAGIDLVHNTGMIGSGKLVAGEAFVLADEILGHLRAAFQQIPLSRSALEEGARLVGEAPAGAEYVSQPHTLDHFRDFWYPRVLDRSNFDPQGEILGAKMEGRLADSRKKLEAGHESQPLEEAVRRELGRLEKSWLRRLDPSA